MLSDIKLLSHNNVWFPFEIYWPLVSCNHATFVLILRIFALNLTPYVLTFDEKIMIKNFLLHHTMIAMSKIACGSSIFYIFCLFFNLVVFACDAMSWSWWLNMIMSIYSGFLNISMLPFLLCKRYYRAKSSKPF